jgi:hypothetical protein
VVLAVVAVALILFGMNLFAHGYRTVPRTKGSEAQPGTGGALSRFRWQDCFRVMRNCIKVMTDRHPSRDERMAATGSFSVLIGIVALVLAVLALIAAVV